jgi:GAF domain-containing protein
MMRFADPFTGTGRHADRDIESGRLMDGLEPIPETVQAVDELDALDADDELLDELVDLSRQVRRLVPTCVGMTVASTETGVAFTLVATDQDVAMFDAVQYLDGGPCVHGARIDSVVTTNHDDLFDESKWQLFAEATAAQGIASTLTLPVVVSGQVVGTVNLYASTRAAFDGHHRSLAGLFSAWAPGAVTNADLSFRTREIAARAPDILRAAARVDTVVGILAATEQISIDEAYERLHQAAPRAGVDESELAETLLELRPRPRTDSTGPAQQTPRHRAR